MHIAICNMEMNYFLLSVL